MDKSQIQAYYSREDIKQKILEISKNREVVGVFPEGAYSKRPNSVSYSADIDSMIKTGIVELHGSIEHWQNPNTLKERVGWDMILDLDCDKTEHGKICAQVLASCLKKHDVKNFSIKFTGGTGFHLGIPWISIPREINYEPSQNLFPDVARKIALYLKEKIRDELRQRLLSKYSVEQLAVDINRPLGEIIKDDGLDPFEIVEVDPILISSRHLFRLPYSLNRNSFLVSMPLKMENLEDFKKEESSPEKIKPVLGFLDSGEKNEAEFLIAETLDWWTKNKPPEQPKKKIEIKEAIKSDFFPPCIKLISQGLKDGKKRGVFVLMNFLSSAKWDWNQIEEYIIEVNKKNQPPLPDSYIKSQIRYNSKKDSKPPPNCPESVTRSEKGSRGYYDSMGVCQPDEICQKIKNPISYPFFVSTETVLKNTESRKQKSNKSKDPRERRENFDM